MKKEDNFAKRSIRKSREQLSRHYSQHCFSSEWGVLSGQLLYSTSPKGMELSLFQLSLQSKENHRWTQCLVPHTFTFRQGWEGFHLERAERFAIQGNFFTLLRAHSDIHLGLRNGGCELVHVCTLLLKQLMKEVGGIITQTAWNLAGTERGRWFEPGWGRAAGEHCSGLPGYFILHISSGILSKGIG